MTATIGDLARLRSLAEAATPGPWQRLLPGDAYSPEAARSPVIALVMALDPQTVLALLDAAALGVAWNRVEAALPEGWAFVGLSQDYWDADPQGAGWFAAWKVASGLVKETDTFDTPTAALTALAAKLEAREP